MNRILLMTCAWLLAFSSQTADAHRPSDAFLTLQVEQAQVQGQWEIALRDLEAAQGLDANGDGRITWGELRQARSALTAFLLPQLQISSDGQPCAWGITDLLVNDRVDGAYAWFALEGHCPAPIQQLSLDYRLLFSIDPTHRGLLTLTSSGTVQSAVFTPQRQVLNLEMGQHSSLRQFLEYLREGVHHIWIGWDHILFLISLLLPCVLLRTPLGWRPVEGFRPAVWSVVSVVTAFTAAHSVTLTLAALDILRLPTRWVECAIALSVLLAAINNLYPLVTQRLWAVAFGFGLVHGFGFASVLGELGLPAGAKLLSLLAFNLGVEIGQLCIVSAAMPLAYAARRSRLYTTLVMQLGSLGICATAALWLYQRLNS